MYTLLLMLISFVLAALAIVSLVKNFFVNFNVSDSGWKTVLVTILIVICLLCAVTSYSEAYTLREINFLLSSPQQSSAEEIEIMKAQIPTRTIMAIVSIIVGYAAYLIHVILINNIRKNKIILIEQNKKNRWVKKE